MTDQTDDTAAITKMCEAYRVAYQASWRASAPVTTQADAVTAENAAVRAGLTAALAVTDRPLAAENARLRQENADLLARLTKAGEVLDVARTAAVDLRIAFGDYDTQTA